MLQLLIDRCSLKITKFTKLNNSGLLVCVTVQSSPWHFLFFSERVFFPPLIDAYHFSETKSTCGLFYKTTTGRSLTITQRQATFFESASQKDIITCSECLVNKKTNLIHYGTLLVITDSIAPCWEQEVEYFCIEYKLYMIYSREVYLKYYIPGNLKYIILEFPRKNSSTSS